MAKILTQCVTNGAKQLLINLLKTDDWKSDQLPSIKADYLEEVPVKLTGLVAGAKEIGWDSYGNPFVHKDDKTRVSLAAVIRCEEKIFVFNRREKYLKNLNEKVDIVGSVGFGLPSFFHKVPQDLWAYPVTSVALTDYMAQETTDGEGDLPNILMPIVIINLLSISGCEKYFVPFHQVDPTGGTAKLQAAIMALKS